MDEIYKMNITITPPDKLLKLALDIRNNDGKLYIVGGSVRDAFLGYEPKDWDAEIHGISIDKLVVLLKRYNATDQVGRAKGVWKIFDTSTTPRIEYDISLPLQKNGELYKDLDLALRSRDLTINALAYDPLDKKLIDPSGGCEDLTVKILRTPNTQNIYDDPLRSFRVCQFASRLDFGVDRTLKETILSLPQDLISNIAGERIFEEFKKIIFRSKDPSVGLFWLSELQLTQRISTEFSFDFSHAIDGVRRLFYSISNMHTLEKWRTTLESYEVLTLVFAILLYNYSEEEKLLFLERLHLHRFEGFDVRTFILRHAVPQQLSPLVTYLDDIPLRRLSDKEGTRLPLLLCYCTEGSIDIRYIERSIEMNISDQPLPSLLSGGDFQKVGITGKEIGNRMRELRERQFIGEIQSTEDAQKWLESISS